MKKPPLDESAWVPQLREFQQKYGLEVTDTSSEAPSAALESLRIAVDEAPSGYVSYLSEALACYEGGQYRAAVLMVWAATIQHLYEVASRRRGGIREFEKANQSRNGSSNRYRKLSRVDDFLYLQESMFIQLGEDAGMYNRNTRKFLTERLDLRNRCGHPTRYTPGREEVVIFIESLLLNVISDNLLNWT